MTHHNSAPPSPAAFAALLVVLWATAIGVWFWMDEWQPHDSAIAVDGPAAV